jgi:LmbE family N-acetylglucosaminyl deacetylase
MTDPAAAVRSLGTIVGVWAHPDDEAYLSGGLMATARDLGLRVVCVTATRGERGTTDPLTWPPERLAAQRTRELRQCLARLGVEEHHWLDYPDGGLPDVPVDEAVGRLAELLTEVRPDTVLSFGGDGVTGHPDHIAVGEWADTAAALAAPEARVLHAAVPESWARRWEDFHTAYGIYSPGYPVPVADSDLALRLDLDAGTAQRKVDALAAQETQTAALIAHLGRQRYTEWVDSECFVDGSR